MTEPVGPAIARLRLHTYLRERREAQGHAASAVAKKMRWSQSKLNRIENGVVTIQPIEVKALLEFYDVQDPEEVERLMDLSEISRERRWWREEKLSQEFKDFVAFESEASGLYGYFALFIPGLLQTPQYAQALSSPAIKEAVADATGMNLTEVRRKRQETLFERLDGDHPPTVNMAIDEAVLLRPVGGPEVMAAQLDHLLAVSKRPTVHLTIVPLDLGAHGGLGGTFGEFERFWVPVGVSLGRRIQLENSNTTFTPYLHPVLVPSFGDGDSEVGFALGLGVDLTLSESWDIRVSGGLGDIEGVGISLAYTR